MEQIMTKKDILDALKVIKQFAEILHDVLNQIPEDQLKAPLPEEMKLGSGWRPTIEGCK